MTDFTLRVGVFWYVMSCSVLSLLSQSSETLVHLCHTAWCHIEENSSLYSWHWKPEVSWIDLGTT